MYTTCIYCHGDLGSNDALEEFPVGRRLAFDSARGRLWVVCRRCERWNLSPLETRWEATEACERRFESTRMRVSSDNIGLARLPEGLELVRVGAPLRDEFAAWRYGDQFGRRRKRAMAYSAVGATAFGIVMVGGTAAGISMGGLFPAIMQGIQRRYRDKTIDRLRNAAGDPVRVQRKHLYTSRIAPAPDGPGWELHVDHVLGWDRKARRRGRSFLTPIEGSGYELRDDRAYTERSTMVVSGDEAVRLASRLMAHANRRGGRRRTVRDAVSRIEEAGHPDVFLPLAARDAARAFDASDRAGLPEKKLARLSKPIEGSLSGLSPDVRLAVEMATQEQAEREALEGELRGLEAMWREAEEIAHIADNLLLPEGVDEFIEAERVPVPAAPAPVRGNRVPAGEAREPTSQDREAT